MQYLFLNLEIRRKIVYTSFRDNKGGSLIAQAIRLITYKNPGKPGFFVKDSCLFFCRKH